RKLQWVVVRAASRTLANKHKSTARQMARKYRGETLGKDVKLRKCLRVVIRRDEEGKYPLVATCGGVCLSRRIKATIRDEPMKPRHWRLDRTEILQRLLADTCEVCGSTEDVQVPHVRKLADLQKPGQPPPPQHVQIMAARRRKTLVVCHECHVKIHAGEHPRE